MTGSIWQVFLFGIFYNLLDKNHTINYTISFI